MLITLYPADTQKVFAIIIVILNAVFCIDQNKNSITSQVMSHSYYTEADD